MPGVPKEGDKERSLKDEHGADAGRHPVGEAPLYEVLLVYVSPHIHAVYVQALRRSHLCVDR